MPVSATVNFAGTVSSENTSTPSSRFSAHADPASTQIVPDASGPSVLRIQYAAPSPVGLLGAGNPAVTIPSRR